MEGESFRTRLQPGSQPLTQQQKPEKEVGKKKAS